jgi:hypothetical protein
MRTGEVDILGGILAQNSTAGRFPASNFGLVAATANDGRRTSAAAGSYPLNQRDQRVGAAAASLDRAAARANDSKYRAHTGPTHSLPHNKPDPPSMLHFIEADSSMQPSAIEAGRPPDFRFRD